MNKHYNTNWNNLRASVASEFYKNHKIVAIFWPTVRPSERVKKSQSEGTLKKELSTFITLLLQTYLEKS